MTLVLNGTTGVSAVDGSASTPAIQGNDSNTGVFFPAADTVAIATGGSERARIDSSGNLLVGTTSGTQNAALSVQRSNTTTATTVANFNNTACTSTTRLANPILRIASNANGGDVNINFSDAVQNNYYFGGNNAGAYVVANSNGVRLSNGGTSWASDSDERLKTDLAPITDATNKVQQLRAVTGRYKTDDEGVSRSFLIAQDVQAVLPEAVDSSDPEALGLRYTEVIPLLVAAIKELKAELDAAEARIAALEVA